jgi:hypothetical protein
MELPRQDPDQLLRAIRNDASTKKSGKLKIFFGYAAGERGIFVTGGRNSGFTRVSEALS